MSELLLKWLNDDLKLSRKITNPERDFSNGFLFGEIFSRYSRQPNFVQFRDGDLETHKFTNFRLLDKPFRLIGIKYDACIANSIMKGDREIIVNLLYKMRVFLEKTSLKFSGANSLDRSESFSTLNSGRVFLNRNKWDNSDSLRTSHDEKSIDLKMFKSVILPRKSDSEPHQSPLQVKSDRRNHSETKKSPKKSIFQIQIKNINKSGAVKEDWEKDLSDYRKLMEKKKEAEIVQKISEGKISIDRTARAKIKKLQERSEVYYSIDAFDKKMGKVTREDFFGFKPTAFQEEYPEVFFKHIQLPELVRKSHDNSALYSIR